MLLSSARDKFCLTAIISIYKKLSLRWELLFFTYLFTSWKFYGIITLGSYLLDKLEFDEENHE